MGDVVQFPNIEKGITLTVGDLRRALAGLPDDMPVSLEIAEPERDTDLAQAFLRSAHVEARCDEIDRLYLWGSYEEDYEEFQAAEDDV